MLTQITEWLLGIIAVSGIWGVFFATVLESFFPPIPSEIVLFSAGFYAKSQDSLLLLFLLAVVAAFGNFVGTLPFYLVSRFSADNLLPKFLKKFGPYLMFTEADLVKTQRYFDKKGGITVFAARLVPGIRSLVAFPAGAAKMNFVKYTLYTLAGSLTWNLILSGIGFWAFGYKDQVLAVLDPISSFILVLVVAATILYCLRVAYQIRKLKRQAAAQSIS